MIAALLCVLLIQYLAIRERKQKLAIEEQAESSNEDKLEFEDKKPGGDVLVNELKEMRI